MLAQDASQTQSFSNQIEGLEVAEQGGAIYVRLTLREPLASPPPSFSVANPARIAFDFPGTANALGRNVQAIDQASQRVTGTVRLKLYKGNVIITGRKSPNSLYDEELVTFEEDSVYDQRDAQGFIKLNALRLRTLGLSKQR